MALIKREQFEDNLKQEALINKSFVPIFRLREQEHYYILTADYITYTQEYKVFECKTGLYVCTTPLNGDRKGVASVNPLQPQPTTKGLKPKEPPNFNIL